MKHSDDINEVIALAHEHVKEATKELMQLRQFNGFNNLATQIMGETKFTDILKQITTFKIEQVEREKFFYEELLREIEKGGVKYGNSNQGN